MNKAQKILKTFLKEADNKELEVENRLSIVDKYVRKLRSTLNNNGYHENHNVQILLKKFSEKYDKELGKELIKKLKNDKDFRNKDAIKQIENILMMVQLIKQKYPYKKAEINIEDKSTVGKHIDVSDDKFNSEQLKRGIEIEMEHTDNKDIAKEIAKDHLSELPNYYTLLDKMEEEGKKALEKESCGNPEACQKISKMLRKVAKKL